MKNYLDGVRKKISISNYCIEITPGKIFIFYSCYIISMHRNIMVFIMSLYVAMVRFKV